jgi:ubiquinone/menaquinone biosynthesis C-methylase UbiE
MPAPSEGQPPIGAWQLFDRDASTYEDWYATPRGRRADRAERALLESLLAPFATAQSALEVGCGTAHFTRWLAGRLRYVVGLDRAAAMVTEARQRHPRVPLIQGDAHHLPIRDRAVDLSIFVVTLEFVDRPARALTEAIRVARQGVLVVAMNRWSLGGLSRRWGADARRPLLGQARDFSSASLHALAAASAGGRLRHLRWAYSLFPGSRAAVAERIPFGDVIGIAVELTDPS